jgi:glycosyltransferase involved in cell wall biosynthesis
MKVAHIIPYMNERAGGPVVVVDRWCEQLAHRGCEPIVLTTDNGGQTSPPHKSASYAAYRHPATFGRYAYSPSLRRQLDALVPQCDLVHVHTLWTYPTYTAARCCRRHGIPYVIMPHGMLDPHSRARKRLRKAIYGQLVEWNNIRRASAMIYTTSQEQALAEASLSLLPKGAVVPLGADEPPASRDALAEQFLATRPELRNKQLITFLGRVHEKKGLDLLIPAFARLADNPAAHLLIIGPDDTDYWPTIARRAEALGLTKRMHRIDMLTGIEKWQALAASTLFVLPSYQENFAIAAAEACQIGTPVIISRRVNIWPTIEQGGAGTVIDCSIDQLHAAMNRYVQDVSRWSQASQNARCTAQEHFSWQSSVDALMDVYNHARNTAPRIAPIPQYGTGAIGTP